MSEKIVTQQLLLPDLRFVKQERVKNIRYIYCEKVSEFEVCPKCAAKCFTTYDHVNVTIKDAPIRSKNIILKIRKRRFYCKNCKSIFREPVGGIFKRFRTSERFRRHLMWCASRRPAKLEFPPTQLTKIINYCYHPLYKDSDFLHQKYVVEGLSTTEISAIIFSSHSTVLKYLKLNGIPLRKQGEFKNKGQLGYGENWNKGRIQENKREQKLIRKIKKMRKDGASYWKIAEQLNDKKIVTKTGKGLWHAKTVYNIIN